MNFKEIYERCQRDNRSLIMPSNFPTGKVPAWYTELNLAVRGQSELDRLYLEYTYPLSESMIPYDSNGVFQLTLSGILAKNEYRLNNMYKTIIQEYSPIENYDRYEDTSIDSDGTSSTESTESTTLKKTGTDTVTKSGSVISTKTGSITDSETEATSNTKTGSVDISKNGRENHTKGGSALETVTETGTETKTTSGETLTSNKQRAFNSSTLVETSATSNTMPTKVSDTTSFDGRTTSKETNFTNYSDDVFYDNVTDKTEYNNVLENISTEKTGNQTFSDVTDTQTFDGYVDTTTYNTDESGTDSTSTSGSNKSNQKTLSHIHGNIGVTTTAQMLESERKLSNFDFIDILYKTIIFELSTGYVESEWRYD